MRRSTRTALVVTAALTVLTTAGTTAATAGTVRPRGGPLVGPAADTGTPDASRRPTVLARDKAGVLWQYESSGRADRPLGARERVGGGWNVYTAITSLTSRTAAGEGDLVARDKAGVLWYYRGSGDPDAPFEPRVRIGGGWNQYTALAANNGGLVARDKDGRLWLHRATGSNDPARMLGTRELLGGGWNTYTLIASRGGGYELVARDASGVLWAYGPRYSPAQNPGAYGPRTRVGGGWNVYDSVVAAGDLDGGEFFDDFLARDRDGRLWLYAGRPNAGGSATVPGPARRQIGYGWGVYDVIL
ncbi:tachylectin-related carbohydrate-binding protein [Streptomyces sp. NPDC057540]|uniref:tachylectin-related carbohydrate-binding protein n=1 Tax=Streptomyces sp. NPDC057540 TaxID=3346160 RepID=UPI0036A43F3D